MCTNKPARDDYELGALSSRIFWRKKVDEQKTRAEQAEREREKALAKLPPDKQQQIRERIQKFNQQFSQLPKEEQQRLREGAQKINRMPPAQQQAIRRDLRRFNQLPPDRRQALLKEFAKLRNMPSADRNTYLAGDQFRNRYSADEQQMIQNISKVFPDPHKQQ